MQPHLYLSYFFLRTAHLINKLCIVGKPVSGSSAVLSVSNSQQEANWKLPRHPENIISSTIGDCRLSSTDLQSSFAKYAQTILTRLLTVSLWSHWAARRPVCLFQSSKPPNKSQCRKKLFVSTENICHIFHVFSPDTQLCCSPYNSEFNVAPF